MKITITAIAAMFSLLMLFAPRPASAANPGKWQPAGIQQVGFFSGRPIACHNHYFRRHHWHLCR